MPLAHRSRAATARRRRNAIPLVVPESHRRCNSTCPEPSRPPGQVLCVSAASPPFAGHRHHPHPPTPTPKAVASPLLLSSLVSVKDMDDRMFCFIHEGSELVKCNDGSVEYKGGRTKSIVVPCSISFDSFLERVHVKMGIGANEFNVHFTVKFEPSCMLSLQDDESIKEMFSFNDMNCHVYLTPRVAPEEVVHQPSSMPTTFVGSNSCHGVITISNTPYDRPNDTILESPIVGPAGFFVRCAESHVAPLDSSRFDTAVMGTGQTFRNANEFCDAIYLMSLAGRFCYNFKRNCPKHMTVVCKVDECPWKITCHE